ncbi:hypothetical protein [Hydrogenivirga sp. 128-5-R1-1]|uniref:hypothetical protein n=1 Tax=Hydrogenivirga sp. 128-5-R1-1 TaxID=392423 RepID=UPI00015F187A|nr:hypothetical protein [Hydrogenivirga sp. 128-5-R1-1]EDP75396.1 hypothetical protein HG1285_15566 [Hydrogenivirga sp. 128-5-R1-1]
MFSPVSFKDIAVKLPRLQQHAIVDSAALIRTSVSRFYYSAFLEGREVLLRELNVRRREKMYLMRAISHVLVRETFLRTNRYANLGNLLLTLSELRKNADYTLNIVFGWTEYNLAKKHASLILSELKSVHGSEELDNAYLSILSEMT